MVADILEFSSEVSGRIGISQRLLISFRRAEETRTVSDSKKPLKIKVLLKTALFN